MNDVNFFETNPQTIRDEMFAVIEENIGEKLYPGDERYAFTMATVAAVVAINQRGNDRLRQSLLRYARGSVLDALGERVGCERMPGTAATTTLRFSAVTPDHDRNIIIPVQTRVTADSVTYFATSSLAVIQSGEQYVDVEAACTTSGTVGNAYAAGDIKTLVDIVPYVSVVNLDATHGGDDGEQYDQDGDDHYRDRIHLASEAYSTAGPVGGYEYHAKSADPSVGDVKVVSELPGEVTIRPLLTDGRVPGEELREKVLEAVNAREVRPMTDLVRTAVPTEVEYDINLVYYVTLEDEADVVRTVEGTGGAIERYVEWQSGALGRDVNPDRLRALVLAPDWEQGLKRALRIDIAAPVYQQLDKDKVAKWSGTMTVRHEVAEE